jgi:GT2 family glycosyltransferase
VTDLSIVILSWNSLEVLESCLQSIEREVLSRRDDGRLEVETIVVDNGSTDGTVAAVRERYPFVELISLDENLGFARGNNVGLRRACGRLAVLLNSDTVVKRDGLEACVRYLDAHPDVGVVGPQLLNSDGSKQNCVHNYPSLVTEIVPKGLLEALWPRRFPSKRYAHATPLDVQAVIGACLVVRREVLEQVGLMPEDYFFFMEETDWCYRIRRAGWRIVHVPDAALALPVLPQASRGGPGGGRDGPARVQGGPLRARGPSASLDEPRPRTLADALDRSLVAPARLPRRLGARSPGLGGNDVRLLEIGDLLSQALGSGSSPERVDGGLAC